MPFSLQSIVGGFKPPLTETEWAAYEWPGDDKPDWTDIMTAGLTARLKQAQFDKLHSASLECRRRIYKAYGTDNFKDEIFTRLSGASLTTQNTERDRLLAKHTILKATINTAITLEALDKIDVTTNDHWSDSV